MTASPHWRVRKTPWCCFIGVLVARIDQRELLAGSMLRMTSLPEPCFCGSDSSATCVRCGERRCSSHYYVSVQYSYDWTQVQTPDRTSTLTFPENWSEVKKKAYSFSGPGCTRCREHAAQVAQQLADNRLAEAVDAYVAEPTKSRLREVLAAWPDDNSYWSKPSAVDDDETLRRLLAVVASQIGLTHELLEVRVDLDSSRKRHVTARVTVESREPVAMLPRTRIARVASGRMLPVGGGVPFPAANGAEGQLICDRGITPTVTYSPGGSAGSGYSWGPSVSFKGAEVIGGRMPHPAVSILQDAIAAHPE